MERSREVRFVSSGVKLPSAAAASAPAAALAPEPAHLSAELPFAYIRRDIDAAVRRVVASFRLVPIARADTGPPPSRKHGKVGAGEDRVQGADQRGSSAGQGRGAPGAARAGGGGRGGAARVPPQRGRCGRTRTASWRVGSSARAFPSPLTPATAYVSSLWWSRTSFMGLSVTEPTCFLPNSWKTLFVTAMGKLSI
uniref:Uncharacterized protein n=1 Tax=Arundo donax TaxID=35708 RepID=A0A0A9G510_ARUDO